MKTVTRIESNSGLVSWLFMFMGISLIVYSTMRETAANWQGFAFGAALLFCSLIIAVVAPRETFEK